MSAGWPIDRAPRAPQHSRERAVIAAGSRSSVRGVPAGLLPLAFRAQPIRCSAVLARRDRLGQGASRRYRRYGKGTRDHGGAARDGREQYLRRHADHQGREARRKGGEEERLLPLRTPLWLLPALVRSRWQAQKSEKKIAIKRA